MEPQLIAHENIPLILPLVEKDIVQLLDTFVVNEESYSEVVKDLCTAQRQLWILPTQDMQVQGWLITKILALGYNQRRLVLDMLGGEDISELIKHLPLVEAWATQYGVTESLAYSRPGLRKQLKREGFSHVCDIMIKPTKGRIH